MRTTVNIEDHLLAAAKQRALSRHTTLGAIIEEALRLALQGPSAVPADQSFELVTFKGDGPLPGVNLDKTSALLEVEDLERIGGIGT